MSNNKSHEEQDAQEIVNLRLELFKTKSKLQNYEKNQQKSDNYEKLLKSMMAQAQKRSNKVAELGRLLGIDSKNRLLSVSQMRSGEKDESIVQRCQKIVKALACENDVLAQIKDAIGSQLNSNKQISHKYERICQQHTHCVSMQTSQALKTELKHKEAQVQSLRQINTQLEHQINHLKAAESDFSTKINQLEFQLHHQNKQNQVHRQVFEQEKEKEQQKQRVLKKCERLLQIVKIPNEEYLKYYFRSNGLAMENQRQHKNKYSIVFDT